MRDSPRAKNTLPLELQSYKESASIPEQAGKPSEGVKQEAICVLAESLWLLCGE